MFSHKSQILYLVLGLLILVGMYLFQGIDYFAKAALLVGWNEAVTPSVNFIFNKTFRLVVNDMACFLIILACFKEKKYLLVSFWLLLIELFCILPVYFFFKLRLEGVSEISSPLLSFVHRLIVNPMLMLVLIVGFFYQKVRERAIRF